MPRSTTEIANVVMHRKDGPVPFVLQKTAERKPFVVSSLYTKRYAPSKRVPVEKLPPVPRPPSAKERLSVPRVVPTSQTSRPGAFLTVISKAEQRRSSFKAMPMAGSKKTTKVEKSPALPPVASAKESPFKKAFVPKPLKIVERLREGKLMGGFAGRASTTRKPTESEHPPRPSCVPRSRNYRPSVSVSECPNAKKALTSTVAPRGLCGAVVSGTKSSAYSWIAESGYYVDCTPPPSPDLSSFPSQSWTIVVNVDVKRVKTETTICNEGSLGNSPNLGVAGSPSDSCGPPESTSSSPTLRSSPAVLGTLASTAESTVDVDGMANISTSTKGTSAEVSHAIGAATIISPSKDCTTSSMATLAKVIDNQASSPTGSQIGNRTLTTVHRAFEIARSLFSPSRRASQPGTETAPPKSMGTNVSRVRKVFIPPLDEDAKASKNATTQMEIEMLRAQKKVAGGGVVDPRLSRLTSLASMAIVTKRLGMFGSDSSARI